MKKILVTGGCGFIGSNFIRYWLKKYPQDVITNFDKLTYAGHLSSTKDFSTNKNYRFVKADICDSKVLDGSMKDIDIVVHFAAESHVDRSILNPQVFIKTNVFGTQVLLDAALKHKIKRFHHVSTDEVFGALPLGGGRFNENSRYNPRNPYSASKAASDHLVRAYYETFGLPITITNSSNNYGPYQDPEKWIPRSIISLVDNQFMMVYGDGKHVRDWIYVKDHIRAIDIVIKRGRVGETYLIGGLTKDMDNLALARSLLKIFNLPARILKNNPHLKFIQDRPGHDRRYAVNWSKIKNELGWKPEHDFNSWLIETVEWYKDNKWWWQPI